MEELLNKLIEKGWNVFPDKKFFWNKDKLRFSKWKKCVWFWNDDYTLRELVSKESWLWQFVCENGMVKKLWDNFKYFYNSRDNKSSLRYYEDRYKYWLLESALKDESKLEQFLFDNIKIEWIKLNE